MTAYIALLKAVNIAFTSNLAAKDLIQQKNINGRVI
ncbi:hypothetical protein HY3_05395 [Hyphomonas pacifica]|uniref:Uncharacterized protein n=1 Tax=Hyphomonas pacifica TaxID=1280941 RepID=A0A062U5A7_9PROT|nr:hypothetical protein HY2_10865 [Hyphomonas pacifica]RAN30583.1 hypothetical protein HY3_05395 [Hyphomonas pacifica]RAN38071.1 hypothetical protein HY11_07340 [Hyphomonas pacifica]